MSSFKVWSQYEDKDDYEDYNGAGVHDVCEQHSLKHLHDLKDGDHIIMFCQEYGSTLILKVKVTMEMVPELHSKIIN